MNLIQDGGREGVSRELRALYEKILGDDLEPDEIDDIVGVQIEILSSSNIMRLSLQDRMAEFEYVLKKTLEDKSFFRKLNETSIKSGVDLKHMILFATKYSDTELFSSLMDMEEIDDDLASKILYLSSEGRILGLNELEPLQDASMEELQDMEKEKRTGITSNVRGGPTAKNLEHIFPDGELREIRRIDVDGRVFKRGVASSESHEDTVDAIYQDTIHFPDNCDTAIKKAVFASKELTSVTFIVEGNTCFIVISSDINGRQKGLCKKMIDSSIESGEFGIYAYDREIDDFYVPYEDTLNKERALDFIININNREVEEADETIQTLDDGFVLSSSNIDIDTLTKNVSTSEMNNIMKDWKKELREDIIDIDDNMQK